MWRRRLCSVVKIWVSPPLPVLMVALPAVLVLMKFVPPPLLLLMVALAAVLVIKELREPAQ